MLLRFTTAGSVDDGKSTLIGRLLLDTRNLHQDRWHEVERASRARGDEAVDLALVTDGLRAEREQRITIDVAYRYFATPKRKFIMADTPGHEQYTRNMVTGASTAELAVLLVDARKGVTTQSKRHAFISTLLGVPHLVVAVNKMDLVSYSEAEFDAIAGTFRNFASRLQARNITYVPISALHGDNVVKGSSRMPWYEGPTLLHLLEEVRLGASTNVLDFRFPVQYVIRPHQDFRGYAGQVGSGRVTPGEEVVVLPSRRRTRIKAIHTPEGEIGETVAGDSVVLTLEDQIDVGRGSMLVRARNLPAVGTRLDATLCWLDEIPLQVGRSYLLRHTTREVKVRITELDYAIDVNTMHRLPAQSLELNEIGRAQLLTSAPIFFDPYTTNRATGNFILVDPQTHGTVAAGMIRGRSGRAPEEALQSEVSREDRERRHRHRAAVVWFTGFSGAGKSTLAEALLKRLFARGVETFHLDGDKLRNGLNSDLGFEPGDRAENIRRVAEVARLAFEHGQVVLCSFISPYAREREFARGLLPQGRFFEIHVDCPLEVCKARDPKGLYQRVERGELTRFTGVDAPYEAPLEPELVLNTESIPIEECVERLVELLAQAGIL